MNVSGKLNPRQNIKSALENKAPGSLQRKYLYAAPEAAGIQQGERVSSSAECGCFISPRVRDYGKLRNE